MAETTTTTTKRTTARRRTRTFSYGVLWCPLVVLLSRCRVVVAAALVINDHHHYVGDERVVLLDKDRVAAVTVHAPPVPHADRVAPDRLSPADRDVVAAQLGHLPSNVVSVSGRSGSDHRPVAVRTYPVGGGAPRRRRRAAGDRTPFPTLFWLTCPRLSRAISTLEFEGAAADFRERLDSDDGRGRDARARMRASHEDYARERWGTLRDDDRAWLTSDEVPPGFRTMLERSGVAGTDLGATTATTGRTPSLKCLHAHYAHYVSGGRDNVVGEWTHRLLTERFPECL